MTIINKKIGATFDILLVGTPGIEPGLYAPEAYVLPVYYVPELFTHCISFSLIRQFLLPTLLSCLPLPEKDFLIPDRIISPIFPLG